jgi:hypothetical protein
MPMGVSIEEKINERAICSTHGFIMQARCQKKSPHQPFAKPMGAIGDSGPRQYSGSHQLFVTANPMPRKPPSNRAQMADGGSEGFEIMGGASCSSHELIEQTRC